MSKEERPVRVQRKPRSVTASDMYRMSRVARDGRVPRTCMSVILLQPLTSTMERAPCPLRGVIVEIFKHPLKKRVERLESVDSGARSEIPLQPIILRSERAGCLRLQGVT